MSNSKFIMAKKLHNVQKNLRDKTIGPSLNSLMPLIFEECSKENLTFWFNFLENEAVLNLRDIGHENYELNIRYHYDSEARGYDSKKIKSELLTNAFLLTPSTNAVSITLGNQKQLDILTGDKPVPSHIRKAINTLEAKGVPVTIESIKNHLPLGEMSTDARIQCSNYLKQMEATK